MKSNSHQIGAWIAFAISQLVMGMFTVTGWFILLPFCVANAWTRDVASIKDGRTIDRWTWQPLNWIFGNPEDGVSGSTAIVWKEGKPYPYGCNYPRWMRAWMWSAWRNASDSLKYAFAWRGTMEPPPYVNWTFTAFRARWIFQAGWQPYPWINPYPYVPVLSLVKAPQ